MAPTDGAFGRANCPNCDCPMARMFSTRFSDPRLGIVGIPRREFSGSKQLHDIADREPA